MQTLLPNMANYAFCRLGGGGGGLDPPVGYVPLPLTFFFSGFLC